MSGKVRKRIGNVQGPPGATFTPDVSATLDLSWTNDGGLTNPPTVNLKDAIPAATTSEAGLMSANDKATLEQAVTDIAGKLDASRVGVSGGVAELDENGKVPSAQLPSFVDDVLERASLSAFPSPGESGKIYVAVDTNLSYRWSGSGYVEISPSLALGETPSTAHRGDHGKAAYAHSQTTGNAHNMVKADIGLGNVDNTSDADKPVSTPQRAALDLKQDKLPVTGAANRGVYVSASGVVSQMAHTLDADVPAGAQFTDTVTLVDDTFKNTGQAADAKVTGNKIASLEAQNAVMRELIIGSNAEYTHKASGNPAAFDDGAAANLKSLTVTITPTQTGSGDPSSSNVRPFAGYDSIKILRYERNLSPESSVTFTGTPASPGAGYFQMNLLRPLSAGTYTLSADLSTDYEGVVSLIANRLGLV